MRGAIDRPREAALASRQPPPRQGVPHGVEEEDRSQDPYHQTRRTRATPRRTAVAKPKAKAKAAPVRKKKTAVARRVAQARVAAARARRKGER